MFEMLQQAVHHVRTAYGVSHKTYGGGNIKGINMPLHGIGQGNGASPAIWAVISCLILEVMHKQGYVAMFLSAISWMSIALCGFLFVDDADLLFMAQTIHQQGEEIAGVLKGIWMNGKALSVLLEGLSSQVRGGLQMGWYTDWIYQDTADMPASISVQTQLVQHTKNSRSRECTCC
jgi:hypothetical protein